MPDDPPQKPAPKGPVVFGIYEGRIKVADDAFDPLTEEELAAWYGPEAKEDSSETHQRS